MGQWTRTSYLLDWILPTYRLHFAHSAVGGGWQTDLVLLNTNSVAVEAMVDVFDQDGAQRTKEPLTLEG